MRNHPWHTSAISQLRTLILQLPNGLRKVSENALLCKIRPPFRNCPPYRETKNHPLASLLNGINSIFPIRTGHLNFKKVPRGPKPEHPPVCPLLRLSKLRAPPTVFSTQPWLELEVLIPIDSPENPKRRTYLRLHIRASAATSRPISG